MPRITDFMLLKQTQQPIVSIRKTISVQEIPVILGECFGKLGQYLEQNNEIPVELPFVAFHNVRNLDESNVDIEIGFPVSREIHSDPEINSYTLPEAKKVFCMFRGDYNEMPPMYEEMWKWIRENGYTDNNVAYEVYYNSIGYPMEDMLTKVVMFITD